MRVIQKAGRLSPVPFEFDCTDVQDFMSPIQQQKMLWCTQFHKLMMCAFAEPGLFSLFCCKCAKVFAIFFANFVNFLVSLQFLLGNYFDLDKSHILDQFLLGNDFNLEKSTTFPKFLPETKPFVKYLSPSGFSAKTFNKINLFPKLLKKSSF